MPLEVFALAALVLVGVGIYGLLSERVAERTREIGVRTALGASGGALDAAIYLGVVTLLGVVELVAGSVPAWRAARVGPALPLRAE